MIECIEDENTLVTEKISQSKFAYFVFKLNYYRKLNMTMTSLIQNKKLEVQKVKDLESRIIEFKE